ncbi:MAG: Uma2 family endonuclease [Chloroflexales bacterium]
MSTKIHLLTAEEFAALPGSRHQELVFGEVVEIMPPGGSHGKIALRIGKLLDNWAEKGQAGVVGVESGFILARDPDLVRGPDAYYVRAERVPTEGVPDGFWNIAPDLAIEVVSPGDTADEVEAKVFEYLAAGSAADGNVGIQAGKVYNFLLSPAWARHNKPLQHDSGFRYRVDSIAQIANLYY